MPVVNIYRMIVEELAGRRRRAAGEEDLDWEDWEDGEEDWEEGRRGLQYAFSCSFLFVNGGSEAPGPVQRRRRKRRRKKIARWGTRGGGGVRRLL